MVNFRDSFDVTPREKSVLEEKAARRLELRNEYLKKYHNPFKPSSGIMFDAPIQRLMSLRSTQRENFKPNALNFCVHFMIVFVPFGILAAAVKKERGIREHQLRTGQIAYKDRFNKFA